MSLFLNDIIVNGGQIKNFVGDNLKRCIAKNCLGHSATFPCEYCFGKGVRCQKIAKNDSRIKKNFLKIKSKLRNLDCGELDISDLENELENTEKKFQKKSFLAWPASTRDSEPRTVEKHLQIIKKLEKGPLTREEAKGVLGPSPLMNIPNFDYIRDTTTEYLHSVCLGVAKRMIILTFNVGETRTRVTKRKLSDPSLFNSLMQDIKSTREFSRRNRELDFAVLKGQEFRNIVLFYFPVVLRCIVEKEAKERKLWLLFVYMIRSCVLPEEEFKNVDLDNIDSACIQFYELYEKLFGACNCSYNTHTVCSHLIEMRYHGPLTLIYLCFLL